MLHRLPNVQWVRLKLGKLLIYKTVHSGRPQYLATCCSVTSIQDLRAHPPLNYSQFRETVSQFPHLHFSTAQYSRIRIQSSSHSYHLKVHVIKPTSSCQLLPQRLPQSHRPCFRIIVDALSINVNLLRNFIRAFIQLVKNKGPLASVVFHVVTCITDHTYSIKANAHT